MYSKVNYEKHNKLIVDYYNQLKPDIEFSEFKSIVSLPFKLLKETMNDDELLDFRFIYLGSFQVVPGYIVAGLVTTEYKFNHDRLANNVYISRMKIFLSYIGKYPAKFKKHSKKIQKWISL